LFLGGYYRDPDCFPLLDAEWFANGLCDAYRCVDQLVAAVARIAPYHRYA
jgi:hypothetical protein